MAPPPLAVVGGVEVPPAGGVPAVAGFRAAGGPVVVGFGAALGPVGAALGPVGAAFWSGDVVSVLGLDLARADAEPAVGRVLACAICLPAATNAVVTGSCAGRGLVPARFVPAAKLPGAPLVATSVPVVATGVPVVRPWESDLLPLPLRANNPPPASPATNAPPTSATTAQVAIFGIS